MHKSLKILLLEDSQDDADLIQLNMRQAGIDFTSLVVDTKADFIDALKTFYPDLILSDHSLPQFNSSEALGIFKQYLKNANQSAPFILVTGAVSEEFAVQCIKDGADDYILKDRLQRLPIAIKKTLEKCRIENENRKAIEEKLLLLERYEYLTKATSQAIWDWDIENDSIYCGKGFEKLFGHSCISPFLNTNIHTAYISADEIERVLTGMEKAMENQHQANWFDEYQYLKADGEYAFVSDSAVIIRNAEGTAIRMIGAIQDITAKKDEELRLKLLESVIINTTDGVVIFAMDPSTEQARIVYINDAFTKMNGYTIEEVRGKSFDILKSDKYALEIIEHLPYVFKQNSPAEIEMVSNKKNGDPFWLHLSMAPIADDKGCCSHWVFILRDITQQKNHIKAIEEQNLQLKEIAWVQSHVIRAPLARMMGYIELIDNTQSTSIKNMNLLDIVFRSAQELDGIIRSIVEKSEKINNHL